MGGDIPGTYAPFSYSVLIVAIEGPAGYVVLGIGDEDVFRIGMDHDPVWDTNVFLATVGDKVRADHLFGTDIYDSVRDAVTLRVHVPFRTVIEKGISADAKVRARDIQGIGNHHLVISFLPVHTGWNVPYRNLPGKLPIIYRICPHGYDAD